jgi:hypothetical protein
MRQPSPTIFLRELRQYPVLDPVGHGINGWKNVNNKIRDPMVGSRLGYFFLWGIMGWGNSSK